MIVKFLLLVTGGALFISAVAGAFYIVRRWFFGEGDKPRL